MIKQIKKHLETAAEWILEERNESHPRCTGTEICNKYQSKDSEDQQPQQMLIV